MTAVEAPTSLSYLRPATAGEEDLVARFQPIFDRIAEGNVERERNRTFPYEQVQWLKDADFALVRIPEEFGGWGASLEQTYYLLALLAEADANVAHVWRNHLAFIEDRLNARPSPTNDRWFQRFRDREFVGGGWTEANNGTYATIKTTVTREDDHYKVTGAKFYATGSLYADWLDVIGKGEDGSLITTLVSRHQPGVVVNDDWPGFGQRTTASGSATYQNALAREGDVFPASERVVYQGHFYQTAILAVLAGITRAILRDGIAALKSRGRNYPQGLNPVPALDPQLLQVIGEVSVRVFSTEAALRRAASSLDLIAAAHAAGDVALRDKRAVDGEVAVSQAQLAIIDGVLYAATHVFDALGASATSEETALDRHWRNARTLASHNPVAYKARILGDYLVNDNSPVSSIARLGRGGQGN
ncbi:acyl-CoA dehydrogenase [Mesorhizobium sp. BAC0120]|uniref:acyl-CoA dehydrogenase family protein n=1 Tax=Mesorhizobium sp. BAC0120 TaxID=3090670 RepID=UPI00298D25E2|nr:acyl-CoA dehydrogenase family protein [Mesorhizobium sp. BAC0120]MDW6020613.1 acyl-CoA dehydrogenase [Mesorhizobium sp. BAC0120]